MSASGPAGTPEPGRTIFVAEVRGAGASDRTWKDAPGERTVVEGGGRPEPIRLADSTLPAGGERFGRYVGAEPLARGGMGVVYRAVDPELGRPVAIKAILAGTWAAEGELARFLREAQVTGQLQHPNIPPLYELSATDGQVYFAMKLIEGRSLAELVGDRFDEGPAALAARRDEWLRAIVKVCDALAYAHSRGVIHRDLKPANIMVGPFGEVLVMDWGIARILGTSDVEATPGTTARREVDPIRTMEGAVLGTPAYMSPEQLRGRLEEIDERSDVYGVGSVIYEVLTGTPPEPSPRLGDILAHLESGHWDPPSRRAPRARIPAELDALVARAMHRDRARRYRSALELKDDLEAYLSGRPLAAFRYTAWQRAAKWVRRNKAVTAFLVSVSVLVPLLAVALASSRRASAEARANARRADEQLRDVLALSEASAVDELLDEERLVQAWRGYPGDPRELDAWTLQASAFEGRGDYHQAKLDELEARGEARSSDRWERQNRRHLVARLEELRVALAEARASRAKVAPLVDRAEHGEDRAAWDEAARQGLALPRIAGLAPIGRDPESGLWEFWVVESGSRPERGDGGRLRMEPGSGIVLVLLPAGTFRMGGAALPAEQPVHDVAVPAFLLAKHEMTRGQWRKATGQDPSYDKNGDPLRPVDQVNWHECRRELSRLGLRLPSEAEWEYAARAGTTGEWWTTDFAGAGNLADRTAALWRITHQGETWDDGQAVSSRVGTYRANPFGLHDTIGNLWEWCEDAFGEDYRDAPADGSPRLAPGTPDRVFRGGSYAYPSASARSAFRFRFAPTFRCYDLGVRPARSVP